MGKTKVSKVKPRKIPSGSRTNPEIHLTVDESTSLGGLCGEDKDAGGEHEREGESRGDGVALEVEEERCEHVGRLKFEELKSSPSQKICKKISKDY